jgi:L-seryl-tRNA(Ser) seleniumtransferase
VERISCNSQIGSGALPLETVPSAGIAMKPSAARGQGRALAALAAALRNLPVPVIGHVADGSLVLDLRCLEDEAGFVANLSSLDLAEGQHAGA